MDARRERRSMVEQQLQRRGITDTRVLAAMGEVPRELFVPDAHRGDAYADSALPLSHGQTISQPLMVAMSLEALALDGHENVLDVGSGSGYQSAVLARLAQTVHAVEIVPDLVDAARVRLDLLGIDNVELHLGDGRLGWKDAAPYDAIVVAAAAETTPLALIEQLVDGGRLVIPVGERRGQALTLFRKHEDRVESEELCRCVFVPLVYGD